VIAIVELRNPLAYQEIGDQTPVKEIFLKLSKHCLKLRVELAQFLILVLAVVLPIEENSL